MLLRQPCVGGQLEGASAAERAGGLLAAGGGAGSWGGSTRCCRPATVQEEGLHAATMRERLERLAESLWARVAQEEGKLQEVVAQVGACSACA